jgi:hypothetical protein
MIRTTLVAPPRSEEAQTPQEWGDVKDVRHTFGFRETFTYGLYRRGKIKAASIPGEGRTRGKRIFSFASIREFIAKNEEKPATEEAS